MSTQVVSPLIRNTCVLFVHFFIWSWITVSPRNCYGLQ